MRQESITQEDFKRLLEQDFVNERRFMEVDKKWFCRDCGSQALVHVVAHTIWDGPFEGAGSGKCDYRVVPYCSKCEAGEKATWSSSGAPIRVPWAGHTELRVLRRVALRLSVPYLAHLTKIWKVKLRIDYSF